MSTKKIYYDKPDVFIYAIFEDPNSSIIDTLERIQLELEALGKKPKVLVNCPEKVRINTLNHCFQVTEKLGVNRWNEWGFPIHHCIMICQDFKEKIDLFKETENDNVVIKHVIY